MVFNAENSKKDDRSSFSIEDIEVDNYFKVDIDWSLDAPAFGYIYRIVIDDRLNVDLVVNFKNGKDISDWLSLSVVANNRKLHSWDIGMDNSWNNCSVAILPKSDSIVISYKEDEQKLPLDFPDDTEKLSVYFGLNSTTGFMTSDVASISLRDLAISLSPQKESWHWKFDKHIDNIAYDTINGKKLETNNVNWLIDSHINWRHILCKSYDSNSYIAPTNSRGFYTITDSTVYYTNYDNLEEKAYHLTEPVSLDFSSNQFIVDNNTGELKCLIVDANNYYYSKFNFEDKEWQPNIKFNEKPIYRHSNLMVLPCDSSVMQLFGYGFYNYHSKQFTAKDSGLDTHDISDQISPRYLSATGMVGSDSLYIYGGYGNAAGNQELGAYIYTDMYIYDLANKEITKLWDNLPCSGDELIAKNIVFAQGDSNKAFALFYSHLKYNSFLVLKEMDIDNIALTQYADTLPYLFHDSHSEAQLIYSDSLKELYAITTHATPDNRIEVNIYSIAYPIVDRESLANEVSTNNYWWHLLLLLIPAIIVVYRGRKTKSIPAPELDNEPEVITIPTVQNRKPGIYLLGGFQVINRSGVDITGNFSTLMKHLLLLIILETQKDGKGISSAKLKDYLWFDKNDSSAKNNRGVNIRKIRLLLEECDDFSIVSDRGYWQIALDNSAYCDYIYAYKYLYTISNTQALDINSLSHLIEIANMSLLLPNQNADFFDSFKAEYTDKIIGTLSNQLSLQNDYSSKKMLSEAILIFDSLDEGAIRVKCQYFINTGRHGTARATYDNFAKEYQKSMGEELESNFEEFIKE